MAGIDNNTVLYLRGDSFKDLSPKNVQLTNNGVTTVSDDGLFGKSLNFSVAGKYLTIPASSKFKFGANDFTMEWYEYVLDTSYTELGAIYSNSSTTNTYTLGIIRGTTDGLITFNASKNGTTWTVSKTTNTFDRTARLKTWVHRAVVRSGNIMMFFTDGKLDNTYNWGTSIVFDDNTDASIGRWRINTTDNIRTYLSSFRMSNIARYTTDFTPPTKVFNSIDINVTNQTEDKIDFTVSKLGQETVNKVEVLLNNQVLQEYDAIGDLTYSIDKNTLALGGKIIIRVTFDDSYTEEKEVYIEPFITQLPTSSSLKELIDRQELLSNSIEVQKNTLKSILESKNVEVSGEDKMSDLIGKVELFDKYVPPILYLYKEGDECVDITGGWIEGYKAGHNPTFTKNADSLQVKANGTSTNGSVGMFATSKSLDLTPYKTVKVIASIITSSSNGYAQMDVASTSTSTVTNALAKYESELGASGSNLKFEVNISSVSSGYVRVGMSGNASNTINIKIHEVWLES